MDAMNMIFDTSSLNKSSDSIKELIARTIFLHVAYSILIKKIRSIRLF